MKLAAAHWICGMINMKTKKSGIVEELKENTRTSGSSPARTEKKNGNAGTDSDSYISDVLMFSKWACRVGKGWYGFSLGDVPRVWTDVLDQFLCWLEIQCRILKFIRSK